MSGETQLEPGWRELLAAAGLEDPQELLDGVPVERLGGKWEALTKAGLGGRERWRWDVDGTGAHVLYVKRYGHTPMREQVDRIRRQAAGHSRAWWEFEQSRALAQRYVPVVRAIGVAERMQSIYELRSAVLFERVSGDAFDRVWPGICEARAPLACAPARQELIRGLARFVSAFHQTGTCHRDLYLCHIFAELDPEGRRPPRFTLIDLGRTHRPRMRRLRWLIKDLSQLDCSARQIGASRADRLRFLVAYLGLAPRAPRVRFYARRVVRKSDRILRRIARQERRS